MRSVITVSPHPTPGGPLARPVGSLQLQGCPDGSCVTGNKVEKGASVGLGRGLVMKKLVCSVFACFVLAVVSPVGATPLHPSKGAPAQGPRRAS